MGYRSMEPADPSISYVKLLPKSDQKLPSESNILYHELLIPWSCAWDIPPKLFSKNELWKISINIVSSCRKIAWLVWFKNVFLKVRVILQD